MVKSHQTSEKKILHKNKKENEQKKKKDTLRNRECSELKKMCENKNYI